MQLKLPPSNPINIKYPLQYAYKGAFATNDTTIDAIADDLKILLKTNWGERVIQYDFGANLRSLLFEPSTNLKQQVTDAIGSAIDKWMSFVTVDRVELILNDMDKTLGDNQAKVQVFFSVGKTGLSGDVTVDIK